MSNLMASFHTRSRFRGVQELAENLCKNKRLSKPEFVKLIEERENVRDFLREEAIVRQQAIFFNEIYKRGLIECSSYCKNNCLYCGIRAENSKAKRCRLTKDSILHCCQSGYELGFRTFVLQAGEDSSFTASFVAEVVSDIHGAFPDCAITLSLGEQEPTTYALWKKAGATRYLLRHEATNDSLYKKLHMNDKPNRTADYRKSCLFALKELGYQTGSGFMVGCPYQTYEDLAEDLLFLHDFQPEMIGIGPFIPHGDTPFFLWNAGSAELTTFLISVLRVMFPYALIPSTTALETIARDGAEQGILAGANVLMIALSTEEMRDSYSLYNGKNKTAKEETLQAVSKMEERLNKIGYCFSAKRGDYSTC